MRIALHDADTIKGANRMFAQLPPKRRTDAPQQRATGGTGYGLFSDLLPEIDDTFPDYSILG